MHVPKFVPNTPDNLHCMQACIMMVMDAIGQPISMEEAERMSDFAPGLYSWIPRAVVEMSRRVPGIEVWDTLDYQRFAEAGGAYFRTYLNNEGWWRDQCAHASPDFVRERQAAREMNGIPQIFEKPTASDLRSRLDTHLFMVNVDSGALLGRPNSESHMILVYGYEDGRFLIHDPGLPPREALRVSEQTLMHAYHDCTVIIPRTAEV